MKIEITKPIHSVKAVHPFGSIPSLHTSPYQIKALTDNSVLSTNRIKTNESTEEENVNKKLCKIRAKLKAGKRLTGLEKSFLLKHAPDLYRTAQRVELQRNALKSQLEHAKSKEEANQIIGSALGAVSDKDPDAEYITAGLHEEAKQFQESDAYKELPANRKNAKKGAVYHPYKSRTDDKTGGETTGLYDKRGEFVIRR